MTRIPIIPESTERIADYFPEIQDIYTITNKGKIYSEVANRNLKPKISKKGYEELKLRLKPEFHVGNREEKHFSVHRGVKLCFDPIPNPEKYQVNHVLGIKTINEIEVLEYCTNRENMDHAMRMNLVSKCETKYNATLTNEQVHQICKYLQIGMPYKDISRIMLNRDVDKSISDILSSIKHNRSWSDISLQYNFDISKPHYQIFNDNQIEIILNHISDGLDNNNILKSMNYDLENIPSEVINKLNNDMNAIRNGAKSSRG